MKIALIIAAVVIIGLAIVIATRPAQFRVTRSATMSAPPQRVFEHVNDLHKWDAWSPWAKLDPNAKNAFSGAESGAGATMSWAGNSKVGEGTMTITESVPSERIRMRLEFLRPMKAVNDTEFTFTPEADSTRVTWTMSGTNNFVGKAFSLFVDCDKMIGGDFEKGLATMKSLVEAPVTTSAAR